MFRRKNAHRALAALAVAGAAAATAGRADAAHATVPSSRIQACMVSTLQNPAGTLTEANLKRDSDFEGSLRLTSASKIGNYPVQYILSVDEKNGMVNSLEGNVSQGRAGQVVSDRNPDGMDTTDNFDDVRAETRIAENVRAKLKKFQACRNGL